VFIHGSSFIFKEVSPMRSITVPIGPKLRSFLQAKRSEGFCISRYVIALLEREALIAKPNKKKAA